MAEKVETKPKSNASPDLHMQAYRELRDLTRKKDEVIGSIRAARKRFESLGVNLKAMDFHGRLSKMDDDEREMLFRDASRIGEWIGRPLGFQGALFGADDAERPKESESAAHREWAAHEAGYDNGKNGGNRDDNPYEPGSLFHQKWDVGYFEGQAAIAARMGPNEEARTGSRGRKKRGQAEAAA